MKVSTLSIAPVLVSLAAAACFPYGATFPSGSLSVPSQSVEEWWCPQAQQYGFQGFTYPMEDDCSAFPVSKISADLAEMKKNFGASMIRVYYPVCADGETLFKNLIKAAHEQNMGVIGEIFFGLGNGDPHVQQIQGLVKVLEDPTYGPVARYVLHSINFGSEPIGDGVDGGNQQFASDFEAFKKQMHGYGIKVAISEDWDRPGTMSNGKGGLGPIGQSIKSNSDYCHAHIQPWYKSQTESVSSAWSYIQSMLPFYKNAVNLPTMITETQWAWGTNDHWTSHTNDSPATYKEFWDHYDNNCELFKQYNIGWFLHAWQGESTFDMKEDNGNYAIPNWRPKKC